MYIEYDEYELLELFCNEPISIHEKEAGMFIYSKQDSFGFKLIMNLSIYEKNCSICLTHKDLIKPIFDIKFDDVKRIKGESDKLIIYLENDGRNVIVYFKPNFILEIES